MSEQEKEEFRLLWHQARFGGCGTTLAIFVIVLLLLTSCKTIQYVPVETVVHDTTIVSNVVHISDTTKEKESIKDSSWMSIHEADSTELASMGIRLSGISKAYVVEHNKVRELMNTLSSMKEKESKSDSVMVREKLVNVPYPVERELSRWEQFCLDYGKVTTGATLILFIAVILFIIKRIRQKVG